MTYRRFVPVAALLTVSAFLSACHSTGENDHHSTTSTTATVTVTAATTVATPTADPTKAPHAPQPVNTPSTSAALAPPAHTGASDALRQEKQMSGGASLMATGIRTGVHDGFERVVIDLKGKGEPGWFVYWTDHPARPGSGFPVTIDGTSVLAVSLTGMGYSVENEVYDLPEIDIHPLSSVVKQVVRAGNFESQTDFFIGVSGPKRPVTVSFVANPPRVVVDIPHAA